MNLLTVKNLYVRIEGKVIVENLNYRLKELEARLDPALFVRLARGTLANIEMIARVSPMPGGTFVVTRKNNQQLQASRLQSRRSLDIALKYSASGNSDQVQAAAITILAAVGKNDPRVFPLISAALLKSVSPFNAALFGASGRALVELGDQRGVEVFEQASQKLISPRARPLLQQLVEQLKQKAQAAAPKTPGV
jgi:hypothetical protein